MVNDSRIEAVADSDSAAIAGRIGLATRGVMYLISASLTTQIALSGSSRDGPGKQGALRAAAEQPFGRVLVLILAVGLAGYAIWRFVAAASHSGAEGDPDIKIWAERIGYFGRGLVYLAALATAISLVVGSDSSQGGGGSTVRIFALPAGRWIVLAVGIGILVAAGYNGIRAVTRRYKQNWSDDLTAESERWATIVSSIGLFGHMTVLALVGFFLTKAALEFDPSEPESLDEAVRALADARGGTFYLLVVALAMVAYAGFSFVEARWRRLLE